MSTKSDELKVIRWFSELPEVIRYRFTSQWMEDESKGISIAKLADCIVGDKSNSEPLIKQFRSFDLKNGKLKNVWRPDNGFSQSDVHTVCCAINLYREKNGREDQVTAADFYKRAWVELNQQHPPDSALAGVEQKGSLSIEPRKTEEAVRQQSSPINKRINRKAIMSVVISIMLVIVFLYFKRGPQPVNDLLPQQYLPGNVVQLRQLDKNDQLLTLAQPAHYLYAKICFPDLSFETSTTPISRYTQLAKMKLTDLETKTLLLPDFSATDQLLDSKKVKFNNVSKLLITKGLLNIGMSATCLASMQSVIDYGNKIDYYGVIKKTIVADSITFDMHYDHSASPVVVDKVVGLIQDYFGVHKVSMQPAFVTDDKTTQQVIVNGPLVIAYITHEMSAQMSTL